MVQTRYDSTIVEKSTSFAIKYKYYLNKKWVPTYVLKSCEIYSMLSKCLFVYYSAAISNWFHIICSKQFIIIL